MITNLINIVLAAVIALGLTILIEWGLSFIFIKNKKDKKVVILAQVLTNPALNFLLLLNYNFFSLDQNLLLAILEILVVIIEAIVYKQYFSNKVKINSFLLSLILNATSFTIGLAIQFSCN